MNYDLILGMLLVRSVMRPRLDPLPDEVPLAPIDVAALRGLARRAPVEAPRPEAPEPAENLRRAA